MSGPIRSVPLNRGSIILHYTRPSAVSGASTLVLQASKYPKFSCHLKVRFSVPRPSHLENTTASARCSGVFTAFPRVMPTRLHPARHYSWNAPSFTSKLHPFNSAEEFSLQRRERGKTSRTAQCEHTAIYNLAKKPYFLIYCSPCCARSAFLQSSSLMH